MQSNWLSLDHPIVYSYDSSISCRSPSLYTPYTLCHTLFHSNNLNIKTGKMSSWYVGSVSLEGCEYHSSDSSAFQIPLGLKYKQEERIHRIQVHTQIQICTMYSERKREVGICHFSSTFMEINLHWHRSHLNLAVCLYLQTDVWPLENQLINPTKWMYMALKNIAHGFWSEGIKSGVEGAQRSMLSGKKHFHHVCMLPRLGKKKKK